MKKIIKRIEKKFKKLRSKSEASSLLLTLFFVSITLAIFGVIVAFTLIAIPFVGAWWIWKLLYSKKQETKRQVNSDFYQLLQESHGRVTVLNFALKTNLSGLQEKKYLDKQAREFSANFEVTEEGEIVYCFTSPS